MEEEYVNITEERILELAREIDEVVCSVNEQVAQLQDEDLPF